MNCLKSNIAIRKVIWRERNYHSIIQIELKINKRENVFWFLANLWWKKQKQVIWGWG
jgi:hypothetical protein